MSRRSFPSGLSARGNTERESHFTWRTQRFAASTRCRPNGFANIAVRSTLWTNSTAVHANTTEEKDCNTSSRFPLKQTEREIHRILSCKVTHIRVSTAASPSSHGIFSFSAQESTIYQSRHHQ